MGSFYYGFDSCLRKAGMRKRLILNFGAVMKQLIQLLTGSRHSREGGNPATRVERSNESGFPPSRE
jgi:hypothetical protein